MTPSAVVTQRAEVDRPGWIRRLWRLCLEHPRLLAVIGAAVLAGAAVSIAAPLATKRAVDAAEAGDTSVIGRAAALLVVLAVCRFAVSFARRLWAGRLSLEVQHSLRVSLLAALQRLDGAGQDAIRTGQVVSRSITDLQLVQGLLSMVPWSGLAVLQFVLSAVVMVWLSPPLALAALLVAPLMAVVVLRLRPRLYAATWSAQQRAAELAEHVEQTVTGVRVVKGFGQEARMVDRLEEHGRTLYAERLRAARINARFAPVVSALPQAGLVAVIIVGGVLAAHGAIGIGTFLAFTAYLATMTTSARTITSTVIMSQLTKSAADRVFQVIDAAPVLVDPAEPAELPPGPLGIEFERVGFGFTRGEPVLSDLDLTVRPGETVAIIGPAGSGKSTLSLLLPRFYAPDSGTIRLTGTDGTRVDLTDLRAEDLRGALGVVFDDPFLFSDTIAANIALGRPEATDAEIRAAATAAVADEFIAELPDGYDTVIGERGLTLSGGQRQRIALARALLTRPRVLVLDDATSAVDAVTEAEIFRRLPDPGGRTTLILAHRESTLAQADRVIRLPAPTGSVVPTVRTDKRPTIADRPRAMAAADLSETPELRAAVDALPPATEQPDLPGDLRAPQPDFGLRALLSPVRGLVTLVVLLLIADAVIGIAFPPLVRYAIDTGVTGGQSSALAVTAVVGIGLVLASLAVGAAVTVLTARTGERVLFGLRVRSYAQLQRLGLDFYERELSGRIMTRMTTDVDALSTFLQTGVATGLVAVITLVGVAVGLVVIDAGLALVVLATVPPMLLATLLFRRVSTTAYTVSRERVSAVNADFQENIAGLRAVQAARNEPVAARRFGEYSNRYREARIRAQRAIACYFSFGLAWADLALAVVVYLGANAVADGRTSTGTLVAFVLYLGLLFSPIQELSQVFDGYQQARVGLRRIGDLLRTPSSIAADPPDAVRIDRLRGEVVFDDVHFRYPGANFPALDGVSFTLPAGRTLALVGPTGAGKSTIVKLLARLYDLPGEPSAGEIRVDGVDLRKFVLTEYRSRLGIVPQEAHLFSGDVASNIAFGQPFATSVDIAQAASAVGAAEMIAGLPRKMNQPVGERGRGLSAGQRQLVALARAELVDPDLLLLDEATSTLDPETEASVLVASRSLARGRTTVVVAHRLATAARADLIGVVEQGRIVEFGSHRELLALGGSYARLWSAGARAERIVSGH
ncbi:ABC transporter ATP-binding protein [Nocardia caishijiensis]|uniref:ATP-binding cassette subfamily B protein n=1 Tax=Nocardia caishijiensis TaxID=184756 RepID=A0ABQ6YKT8_9NOCA|nr:ABC transporter ATP-binding protein [Nocardia caishijiensis]KAF0846200.1 ATP-binding cassette subfamily B protein [Nocardia caishijiensis]